MRYRRFGERFIVRLESGESVVQCLTEFLGQEHIGFATVSAAGAVASVRLAYWNAASHKYEDRDFDEQLEVVSFEGNASLKDDQPFLHLHAVFAREDYSTIGGHLREARVNPTMEVWLRAEDVPVRRVHEDSTGLDLLDLPQS
jgi:predicted DNA-binding protein with PD1-like motif